MVEDGFGRETPFAVRKGSPSQGLSFIEKTLSKSIDRGGRKRYNERETILEEENDMEKLLEILKSIHPDVDFSAEQDLIGDGVLDSLDIVTLITEINSEFDVSIPAEEILPENFSSAEAIFALIERLDEI